MATTKNGKSKKTTPNPNLIKVMFEGVLDVFLPKNFSTLAPAAPGPAPTPPKSPPVPPVHIGSSRHIGWPAVALALLALIGVIWLIDNGFPHPIRHIALPMIGGTQKTAEVTSTPECQRGWSWNSAHGRCESPTPQSELKQYDVAKANCKPGDIKPVKVSVPGHPDVERIVMQKCVYR
ncbi:MAG: hypothetical protein KGJ34_00110 [Patescibacteria group bacterium]|nr:hypothetical protein [Patescibacteria group bacterium]